MKKVSKTINVKPTGEKCDATEGLLKETDGVIEETKRVALDAGVGRPKAWWTEVADADLDNELIWLRTEVYRYEAKRLTAFDRFKG